MAVSDDYKGKGRMVSLLSLRHEKETMEKVKVLVGWDDKNYSAAAEVNGVVVVTHRNLEELKAVFEDAFRFHIEGSIKDGDPLPEAIKNGNYVLEYELQVSALLHKYGNVLTRSALSQMTGINERQLGHYARGTRALRPEQRDRIVQGFHKLGRELLAVE